MYYAGFIESWGRGVEKIRSACAAEGLPEPEYTVHRGDIMIKFTTPEDRIVRVNDGVNVQVNDEVNVHLGEKEKLILPLLRSFQIRRVSAGKQ